METFKNFVLVCSIVSVVWGHPHPHPHLPVDQSFQIPLTYDQIPVSSWQPVNSISDLGLRDYQRNIRSAFDAALPYLEGLQISQPSGPVPLSLQPVKEENSLVSSQPESLSLQLMKNDDTMAGNHPMNQPILIRDLDESNRKTRSAMDYTQELPLEVMEMITRAAREADFLPPVDQSSAPVKNFNKETGTKQEVVDVIDTPGKSYGMYFMRVQTINSFESPDNKEIKTVGNEKSSEDQNKKNTETKESRQRAELLETLHELLMGQLAILLQQQQVQEWNQRVSLQQEMYLKELQGQIMAMKSTDSVSIPTNVPGIQCTDPPQTSSYNSQPETSTAAIFNRDKENSLEGNIHAI